MENASNFKELTERITKDTGHTREEVLGLIKEKKEKFSGLLTDSGAAFMIAKELGIEIGLEGAIASKEKISELKEGQRNVELKARVLGVFSPRSAEKNGKKKKYCSLLLGDENGEIRLTLWEKDVDSLQEKKVEKGDIALVKNCFVSSYNDRLQLSLGYNGKIDYSKEDDPKLPQAKGNVKKVNELSKGMECIDVYARVARVFDLREFHSERGKGSVVNFLIADETGTIRATAWSELAEKAEGLSRGEAVKIENGYTKQGLKGIEFHLGWNSHILSEPNSVKLPEISEIAGERFKRTKIIELEEETDAEILGIVTRVNRVGEFKVCEKCGKKVEEEGNAFLCDRCGEVKPKKRFFTSLVLDDGEENLNCTFFGKNALDALSAEDKGGKNTVEELEKNAREAIIGKTLLVSGRARENRFDTEKIDFIASTVKKPDEEKEIKALEEAMGKV